MTARCPECNSEFYTPDPSFGGAGRNKCLNCGKASQVAHWYVSDKSVVITHRKELVAQFPPGTKVAVASGDPNCLNVTPSERRFFIDESHHLKPAAPIRQYKDDTEE